MPSVEIIKNVILASALTLTIGFGNTALAHERKEPLLEVAKQGSFFFGGKVVTNEIGNTFHGDHGYAQFQIPPNARDLPLVMWHGGNQTAKTFESTPDGREGYQTIFLKRGFSVYIIDQPRRGRAGGSTEGTTIPDAAPNESFTFSAFRWGIWTPPAPPSFFPGVQISRDPAAVDQYLRQGAPNTGASDIDTAPVPEAPDAVSALFDRIGPGVLITHSAGGYVGWLTTLQNKNVKAVVAYEPARFVYPIGSAPAPVPVPGGGGTVFSPGIEVSMSEFLKLTRRPIQVIYGDNIPSQPSSDAGFERWRARLVFARAFVDAINSHGGDAQLVHLPAIGIRGNTHFPFSDLNNLKIADLLSKWLNKKGLDKRSGKRDRDDDDDDHHKGRDRR